MNSRNWKVVLLSLLLGASAAPSVSSRPVQAKSTQFVGEAEVEWEEKWYPLTDGAQQKLLVRRGASDLGLWTQFRNDYDAPIACEAIITSRLAGGRKEKTLCFPRLSPAEIQVFPPLQAQEIIRVEISKLEFKTADVKP